MPFMHPMLWRCSDIEPLMQRATLDIIGLCGFCECKLCTLATVSHAHHQAAAPVSREAPTGRLLPTPVHRGARPLNAGQLWTWPAAVTEVNCWHPQHHPDSAGVLATTLSWRDTYAMSAPCSPVATRLNLRACSIRLQQRPPHQQALHPAGGAAHRGGRGRRQRGLA